MVFSLLPELPQKGCSNEKCSKWGFFYLPFADFFAA